MRQAHLGGLDVDRPRNCESAENQGWNADIKLLDRVDVHNVLAAQHDDAFDRGLHARAAGMAFHGDAIEVEIAAQRARDDFRIESIGIGAGKAVQSFQNIGRAGKALADQGAAAVTPLLCGACRMDALYRRTRLIKLRQATRE